MNNIRKIREEKGITREKLAFMAGSSVTAIQNYEKGKQSPTIGVALRIAKALNVSLDELFGESEDPDKWYYDPKNFNDSWFGGTRLGVYLRMYPEIFRVYPRIFKMFYRYLRDFWQWN